MAVEALTRGLLLTNNPKTRSARAIKRHLPKKSRPPAISFDIDLFLPFIRNTYFIRTYLPNDLMTKFAGFSHCSGLQLTVQNF
jgi:hypothetical protein